MWADRETVVDMINVRHLVSAIVSTATNAELLPTTIGVYGDWGSGKSSLLAMAREELSTRPDVTCVSFDGSLFEGYEDAKTALMSTILDALRADPSLGSELKEKATNLLRRVNWFRLASLAGKFALAVHTGEPALAATGIPDVVGLFRRDPTATASEVQEEVMGAVETTKSLIRDEPHISENELGRSVREFRTEFAELLRESDVKTLVVFIDELDRCLPDTVIDTLQAIRLFLAVPGTAFVIGADERLIEHAVEVRYPLKPDSNHSLDIGRHYLEKMVHHTVRIPPLSRSEATTYMNLLLASLHVSRERISEVCVELLDPEATDLEQVRFDAQAANERFGADDGVDIDKLNEDLLLVEQIADVLTSGLDGNPRQTKRFLNMLMMRLQMARQRKVELQRTVLAKLMLLEYFRLEAFRQLADWQASQSGIPAELTLLEDNVRRSEGAESEEDDSGEDKEAETDASRSGFATWLADAWLVTWLRNAPSLKDVDLRPYFYFSRAQLRSQYALTDALSQPAGDVIGRLTSPSAAIRSQGLKRATDLSAGDASAVFQSLATQVRRTEDLDASPSPLSALLDFVAVRGELLVELITLLQTLPPARLSLSLPPRLARMAGGDPTSHPGIRELLARWARTDDNKPLAKAADMTLRGSR